MVPERNDEQSSVRTPPTEIQEGSGLGFSLEDTRADIRASTQETLALMQELHAKVVEELNRLGEKLRSRRGRPDPGVTG